ncbi:MAG TPA: hypothetical protein VFE78_31670 [Gemmataceae bacterium]|nr:hypothetical protein [Gemmataceae bacterium]
MRPPHCHELRLLVAEVITRLPEDVQRWLCRQTRHVFVGGHGQLGEYRALALPPPAETAGGLAVLRVILLSEQLVRMTKGDASWVIAHEIAHSRLNHRLAGGGYEYIDEAAADKLVRAWGFSEPHGRQAERDTWYIGSPKGGQKPKDDK